MSSIVDWVERLQPSTLHVETDEQGRPRVIKLELPTTRTAAIEREAERGERTVGEMAEVLSALEAQRARDLERIEELTAELAAVRARVARFAQEVVER